MGNRKERPENCIYTEDSQNLVLRIYFDGNAYPNVEAPLGPLFGIFHNTGDNWGAREHGYAVDHALFKVSQNGAMSLTVPMPFAKGCRITIQDENPDRNVKMRIWAQVSYHLFHPACPFTETLRFHAIYRTENLQNVPSYGREEYAYRRSYHVGHSQGSGYLLGFNFGFTQKDKHDVWFHNAGEMIILDHMTSNPVLMKGTGGEDFFGTSCWFHSHHNFKEFGFLYGEDYSFFSGYRFFVEDFQLPYRSSFTFDYGARRDLLSSVVFFYQREPIRPFQEFMPFSQRSLAAPMNMSLFHPPPTGKIVHSWSVSKTIPIAQYTSTNATEFARNANNFVMVLRPFYTMISIGEMFFPYQTNEAYPVSCFVICQGKYHHSKSESVVLIISHDDEIEVYLNDNLVYDGIQMPNVQAVDVIIDVKEGENDFVVKYANHENTNTRAFVFGLNIHPYSERDTRRRKRMMFDIPTAHRVVSNDDQHCT